MVTSFRRFIQISCNLFKVLENLFLKSTTANCPLSIYDSKDSRYFAVSLLSRHAVYFACCDERNEFLYLVRSHEVCAVLVQSLVAIILQIHLKRFLSGTDSVTIGGFLKIESKSLPASFRGPLPVKTI